MGTYLKSKKILLTTAHRDVSSGGSMQLFLLVKGMVEEGADVDILFKKSKAGQSVNLELFKDLPVNIDFFRPNKWYSPGEIVRLRRRLKEKGYHIIHTHKGSDLRLVMLASTGMATPVLVTTRGVSFPLGLNHHQYNLSKLDRIITVSEDNKESMVQSGVRADKISMIYGGVDITRFYPRQKNKEVRKELEIPPEAKVFIVVANLVKQKDHFNYIEAASLVEKSHPGCYHILAGSGGAGPYREKAIEKGLEKQIIFAGFRKDVPDLFSASFASVFPGYAGEGLSGVLRESLACGVPVITTDVGGNKELIKEGKYGYVVPVKDPGALAGAMVRLLEDENLAGEMGRDGKKYIVENHSYKSRNKKIFQLYKEIAFSKGYNWEERG